MGRDTRAKKTTKRPECELLHSDKEKKVAALNESQQKLMKAISSQTIIFAIGAAGTGKTFVSTSLACEGLRSGKIERLIISRPALEAGESLGFMPGDLNEKYQCFLDPFMGVFHECLGSTFTQYLIRHERIQPKPLAFMRGSTFKNSWVILDEGQNATCSQMLMFLTRLGENSKLIITGDPHQSDLREKSGLVEAVAKVGRLPGIAVVDFASTDVVRHSLVQLILDAYKN